jgi:hypothetical protein
MDNSDDDELDSILARITAPRPGFAHAIDSPPAPALSGSIEGGGVPRSHVAEEFVISSTRVDDHEKGNGDITIINPGISSAEPAPRDVDLAVIAELRARVSGLQNELEHEKGQNKLLIWENETLRQTQFHIATGETVSGIILPAMHALTNKIESYGYDIFFTPCIAIC